MKTELHPTPLNRIKLLEKIASGAVVITGNARLASYLLKHYDKWMLEKGHKAWQTPDIISWSAWLGRTFNEHYFHNKEFYNSTLINDAQERIIWEQIIRDSEVNGPLLQVSATARHAAASWQLSRQWDINLDIEKQYLNDDASAFVTWSEIYRERLKKESWVSLNNIAGSLIELLDQEIIFQPDHFILTGFDELSAQQIQLLNRLQQQQCKVEWYENESRNQNVHCIQATEVREEIEWAARWARSILEENKGAKVGIVVPELKELRDIIHSTFDNILMPQNISMATPDGARPFNISLGKTLSQYPYIETALCVLGIKDIMDVEEMSVVINSPYIQGWPEEKYERSQLDKHIRQSGKSSVKLDYVTRSLSDEKKSFSCGDFSVQLEEFIRYKQSLPVVAKPGEWARLFAEMLNVIGFSSGRIFTSEEYQIGQAWNELLYELARLDSTCGVIKYHTMLGYLARYASERVFQPKTQDSPIQVLGIMEASGLEFDNLWVLGLHDGIWPPAPRPDPFIPVNLQRQKNIPHSSAERELKIVENITRRLIASATDVIISYPVMNKTEVLRASPLLKTIPVVDFASLKQWQSPLWKEFIFKSSLVESVEDSPVPIVDGEVVKGGSQIIKLQSLCPFRAFAEIRLGAKPINAAMIGMSPAERGSILHKVLELIWKDISSQEQLLNTGDAELNQLINEAVSRVLNNHDALAPIEIPQHFLELERSRLMQLVLEWMEIEKQRPAFNVLSTEENVELNVGGLSIRLKLDRVDELEQGQKAVIDYKTGNVTPSQWFGDRPQEPQLPLYSIALDEDLAVLAFAQLKTGASVFKGVASDADLLPGIKSFDKLSQSKQFESWLALRNEWHAVVESLADDFCQGKAMVDPLDYPATCMYCTLTQCCRINEISAYTEASPEADT